ncbi:MAG: hypothetical protein MJZ32_02865 [Bacteroidaceae bacterium]|nr:hypothetical protein [Bacteroidaceae bacterium]
MKKLVFVAVLFALVCGCSQEKKTALLPDTNKEITIEDSTIYGEYLDAANHTLELSVASADSAGDTVRIYLPDDTLEYSRIIVGDIVAGSRYAVVGEKDVDGEWDYIAKKVINLSTLMGVWANEGAGKTLNLNEDGSWIMNGHIVAEGDTFDVYNLLPDTLTLEYKEGILDFIRQK